MRAVQSRFNHPGNRASAYMQAYSSQNAGSYLPVASSGSSSLLGDVYFSGRAKAIQSNPLSTSIQPFQAGSGQSLAMRDAVVAYLEKHPDFMKDKDGNSVAIDSQGILNAIETGQPLPLPKGLELSYGMLSPNGQITTTSETFGKVSQYLMRQLPPGQIPAEGLPLILVQQTPETRAALERFESDVVIKNHQVDEVVKDHDGHDVHVQETVPWQSFEKLITGQENRFGDGLAELPLYQLEAPTLGEDQPLRNDLRQRFWPLRRQLMGIKLAQHNYSDQIEFSAGSLIGGAVLGGVMETLAERIPGGTAAAVLLRAAGLDAADVADNFLGQLNATKGNMQANGLDPSIIKAIRDGGPGRKLVKRNLGVAVKGSAVGWVTSPVVATAMTVDPEPISRAVLGAIGALGTSMSIPFMLHATQPQIAEAIRELIAQKKITLPDSVDPNNRKAVDKFVNALARQEILSRVALRSELKAFTVVALAGGLLLIPYVGNYAYMMFAPPIENISTLLIELQDLKVGIPKHMEELRQLVLDHALRGNGSEQPITNKKDIERIQKLFADSWSIASYNALLGSGKALGKASRQVQKLLKGKRIIPITVGSAEMPADLSANTSTPATSDQNLDNPS